MLLRCQISCIGLNSHEALVMDIYKIPVYFCTSSTAVIFVYLFLLAYLATLFQLKGKII